MNVSDTPESIGRYRIRGILGEGSSAVVYAGHDPGIDREVALKCLHQDTADDLGFRRRFLVEARAAGHLTHPHIVTIFDAGETDTGRPYIAMERLSGDTLASRVSNEGFPSIDVILKLATQVAEALDYAHGNGIVHHDIKPENIMFMKGWEHAKVSDFGIAERHRLHSKTEANRGEIAGTPAYMALERMRGEPADARSDLFSLGVVLFWLISGKFPWPEIDDVQALMHERQRVPHPVIEPRDPATPSILVSIVRTLLAPTPEARYQRGAEVIDDLRLARREYEQLHEKPLAARIISLRVRWAASLGIILTLVLLLGLTAIYAKQNSAITGLAQDYGLTVGRMVADDAAENLLLGDKAASRALVLDIARNQQIHYLALADRDHRIVASTLKPEIGTRLGAPGGNRLMSRPDGVQGFRTSAANSPDQNAMLLFDMPVRYQTKTVGELRLGISYAPLQAAQKTTLWVIAIVLIVTLIVVVGAAYWLFRQPLALLDLLGDAMLRVARGDHHYRIRLVRRDELGRLFNAFNLMNSRLQTRDGTTEKSDTMPDIDKLTQPTRIVTPPDDES